MKRLAVVALVVVVGVTFGSSSVAAHAAVDETFPADGATVAAPVDEIRVVFTEPVTLVGNGFEVLDPDGRVVIPEPVTDDDTVFRLVLDEPMAGGDVGVIYEVTSADGHVVSGGFSFRVDAPAPTTVAPTAAPTVAPTTPAPSTSSAPGTTMAPAPATTTVSSTVSSTDSVSTPTSSPTSPPVTTVTTVADDTDTDADADDTGSTGIVIAVVAAILVAGAAFVLFRRRTPG